MVCVSESTPLHDVLRIIKESGYSRIPIYHREPDTISGIIYAKDLIPYSLGMVPFKGLKAIARPVSFVPEQMKASVLLSDMIKKKHPVYSFSSVG